MKTNIKQSLSLIESWLDRKGFVLCKSKKPTIEDEVDFERKVVFLSLRSKPIFQLFSLLHECGHVIVRGRKSYKEDFQDLIEYQETGKKQNTQASVQEVEEEILAWREGEKLAKKLGIVIHKKEYYSYACRWVMGYMVLAGIGRESYLPIAKEAKCDIEEDKTPDLCRILDNANETCYYELISKPKP